MKTKICIAVACHKSSRLPKNSLFLPIQVGSALASRHMNMQRDDEGENISKKNPSYCELTAQYWEWKNVEADYYGLCHYRRFLCMHETKVKLNVRSQIEAGEIDDYNIQRFGLDDEEEMRKLIEDYDLIVGEHQQLDRIPTPRGNKASGYDHWVAHDKALIRTHDLEKMLDILEEVSPRIGASARSYLQEKTFMGFNCFVMKKELFNELCEIEFETLKRLEQEVDLTYYCQQLSRIYGFMGEIISSAYFYDLEKSGKYRVKHVPLLYFNYTNEPKEKTPLRGGVPVVFIEDDGPAFLFGTIWQSFLEHTEKQLLYDVWLITKDDVSDIFVKRIEEMADAYNNVSIRFLDSKYLRFKIGDRIERTVDCPLMPFLPFIFGDYSEALVFGSSMIFMDSIRELWQTKMNKKTLIAAPYDMYMAGRINDIYLETEYNRVRRFLSNPYEYFKVNAAKWNFDEYRKTITIQQIQKSCKMIITGNKGEELLETERCIGNDVVNALCEEKIQLIDQRWDTWFALNDYLEYQLPYAPLKAYNELLKARKKPGVMSYLKDDPWYPKGNELFMPFWTTARKTPFYEEYLAFMMDRRTCKKRKSKQYLIDKVLPANQPMRANIVRFFPKNSKRYRVTRKALQVLRIIKKDDSEND